jgi:diguanylate cyclase (GGDEF)-like protein
VITGATIKTLIVDDDEDDLFLIQDVLRGVETMHYEIMATSSPQRAMESLAKDDFDIIFCDYRMGALTGVDFIKNVRGAGIDTPIILLTGMSDQHVDDAALEAGSSDFISKTAITPDALNRSVRYALAHSTRQKLLQSILKNTRSGIAVINTDGRESLFNSQLETFARLAYGSGIDAKQRLIQTALRCQVKDLVIGDVVFESHVTNLPDNGTLLTIHDVTDRVRDYREKALAEERIRTIAMQDALTGLPNRMAFNSYLDRSLIAARVDGSNVAVLLFDFNRFKEVNDMFGHAAGDYILRNAAEAMRVTLSNDEFCARLGGDEFVLIQKNSDPDSAHELASRVVETLCMSLKWEEKTIDASITVGVALFPLHGGSRKELLANADLAMYRGKSEINRSICVFDAGMDQFIRDRRALALELRRAIQDDGLSLALQPQFETGTGLLAGFESLLRWYSPTRGSVSPTEFISVAEENGLIVEIDRWVINRACKLLKLHPWLPRLAVNVSAKAICLSDLVADIKSAMVENGVSPQRLEIEITETALIHDLNRALHNLRQIKALGITVAMDDFGIGYSSLSMLSSFPFDRIKIDGSFIQQVGNNDRAGAIFKAVVGLGSALKVPVLAEGVESDAQLQFALLAGCQELQGFYFGRPLPQVDLPAMHFELAGMMNIDAFKLWQERRLAPAEQLTSVVDLALA